MTGLYQNWSKRLRGSKSSRGLRGSKSSRGLKRFKEFKRFKRFNEFKRLERLEELGQGAWFAAVVMHYVCFIYASCMHYLWLNQLLSRGELFPSLRRQAAFFT